MNEATHHSLFVPALKGIFAALGSDIAQKGLGFLATLVILHTLVPYDYGLWQLLLSVVTAFDVLLLPAIASMLVADVSREVGAGKKSTAGAILVRAIPLFAALGAIAAGAMAIAAPQVTRISGIDMTLMLRILSVSLIAMGIRQGYQLVLQGSLELAHSQVLKAVDRFSYVVTIFFFVFLFHGGLLGVVSAYAVASFIPVVIYAPIVLPRFRKLIVDREEGHHHFFEAAWVRGKWSLFGDFTSAASASLWPWILGYYLSVAEVGYVSLALLVLGQITSLAPVSFVLRSVLPRTIGVEGRTRAWLARSMKYAIWSQIFGGLGALAFISILFPFVFPLYLSVIPLAAALLITLPIRMIGVVASEWFYAAKKQRALFFTSNLPKVLVLAFLPLSLAHLGMLGFVLWSFVNADIVTYLRIRMVSKEEGGSIPIREIVFPDREDAAIAGRIAAVVREKLRFFPSRV